MSTSTLRTSDNKVQLASWHFARPRTFYLATTAGSAIAIAGLLAWLTTRKSIGNRWEKFELYFTRYFILTIIIEVGIYLFTLWLKNHWMIIIGGVISTTWIFEEMRNALTNSTMNPSIGLLIGTLIIVSICLTKMRWQGTEEQGRAVIGQSKLDPRTDLTTEIIRLRVEVDHLKKQLDLLTASSV